MCVWESVHNLYVWVYIICVCVWFVCIWVCMICVCMICVCECVYDLCMYDLCVWAWFMCVSQCAWFVCVVYEYDLCVCEYDLCVCMIYIWVWLTCVWFVCVSECACFVCMYMICVWVYYFPVSVYVFHMVWLMPGVCIWCVHEVRGNSKCLLLIPPLISSYTEINSPNLLSIIRRRYNFKGIYFKYFKWNAETHMSCTEGENWSVCFAPLTVTSGPDSSLEKTSQELCSICPDSHRRGLIPPGYQAFCLLGQLLPSYLCL